MKPSSMAAPGTPPLNNLSTNPWTNTPNQNPGPPHNAKSRSQKSLHKKPSNGRERTGSLFHTWPCKELRPTTAHSESITSSGKSRPSSAFYSSSAHNQTKPNGSRQSCSPTHSLSLYFTKQVDASLFQSTRFSTPSLPTALCASHCSASLINNHRCDATNRMN